MIVGVRAWAIAVGAGVVAMAGVGAWLALRTPAGPPPCRNSAAVVGPLDYGRECLHPEHAREVYDAGWGRLLVKCVCTAGGGRG